MLAIEYYDICACADDGTTHRIQAKKSETKKRKIE